MKTMMLSETPGEELHLLQSLNDFLEKLRVKRVTKEFIWTRRGLTAGNGRFYQPEDLAVTKSFIFDDEPLPGKFTTLYLIRTADDEFGYCLDRPELPLREKEQSARRYFIDKIPGARVSRSAGTNAGANPVPPDRVLQNRDNRPAAEGCLPADVSQASSLLAARGLTIAFGESATAGRVAYAFSRTGESGEILRGGIVCYNQAVKTGLLGVSESLLAQYTAESAEVTREVAYGVSRLIEADVIVAVTGLVTPGGSESAEKPVGTMFLSVLFEGECHDHVLYCPGDANEVVETAVSQISRVLAALLENSGPVGAE